MKHDTKREKQLERKTKLMLAIQYLKDKHEKERLLTSLRKNIKTLKTLD